MLGKTIIAIDHQDGVHVIRFSDGTMSILVGNLIHLTKLEGTAAAVAPAAEAVKTPAAEAPVAKPAAAALPVAPEPASATSWSAEDIEDLDFDDLKELIEDEGLDIDADEYKGKVKKLRKAVITAMDLDDDDE